MAGFIEVRGVEEEKTAKRAKKHVSFKEGVKVWERGMQICEWNALHLHSKDAQGLVLFSHMRAGLARTYLGQ